jgi:hypothetical protein
MGIRISIIFLWKNIRICDIVPKLVSIWLERVSNFFRYNPCNDVLGGKK